MEKFIVLVVPSEGPYRRKLLSEKELPAFLKLTLKTGGWEELLCDTRRKPNEKSPDILYDIYSNLFMTCSKTQENMRTGVTFEMPEYFFGTQVIIKKQLTRTGVYYRNIGLQMKCPKFDIFTIKGHKMGPLVDVQTNYLADLNKDTLIYH